MKNIDESTKEISFQFINLNGSNYNIGKQLGEKLSKYQENYQNIVTKEFDPRKTGFKDLKDAWELCESYSPGIIEEVQGLADGFAVDPSRIAFAKYFLPEVRKNHCSQFVVLPPITADKSIYVGSSYDYHWSDEDLLFLKTKVNGKFSHLGFSAQALGRVEGMNSKGLVVSMTGGGAFEAPTTNFTSFNYPIAIRALLENCSSVDKAVDLLMEMPIYSSTIFLIVDRKGSAALVECIDSKHAVKWIDPDSPNQFLISTNHYTHPDLILYNKFTHPWLKPNSEIRYNTLNSSIRNLIPNVSKTDVSNLLSKEIPEGVCALYYEEWFGTLWSILFDLKKDCMEVCFGPPTHNIYHNFTINDSYVDSEYVVLYENKFSNFK